MRSANSLSPPPALPLTLESWGKEFCVASAQIQEDGAEWGHNVDRKRELTS